MRLLRKTRPNSHLVLVNCIVLARLQDCMNVAERHGMASPCSPLRTNSGLRQSKNKFETKASHGQHSLNLCMMHYDQVLMLESRKLHRSEKLLSNWFTSQFICMSLHVQSQFIFLGWHHLVVNPMYEEFIAINTKISDKPTD